MSFARTTISALPFAIVSQLIPIFGFFAIAKIVDSATFGYFSTWLAIVLFLGVVFSGRLEGSLVKENDGSDRAETAISVLATIILVSILSTFLLGLLFVFSLNFFSNLEIFFAIAVIPAAALLAAAQTLLDWASADGRYRHLGLFRIAQGSSISLLQITIALIWPDEFGLVLGFFLGAFVGLTVSLVLNPIHWIKLRILLPKLLAFWKIHRHFLIYSLPADVISVASAQLPVLIISIRFGAAEAGLLAMAIRLLGLPMSLISASVLDVFKQRAGKAYRERGECKLVYISAFRLLAILAVLSGVAISLGVEPIFEIFFGASWVGTVAIVYYLLPRFVIGYIAHPLGCVNFISGMQYKDLLWQLSVLSMTIVTLLLGPSIEQALVMYSVGYCFLYLIYLLITYKSSLGNQFGRA